MTIAVFGRSGSDKNIAAVRNLCELAADKDIQLMLHEIFAEKIEERATAMCAWERFSTHEEVVAKADFLMSIGGDGTLLNTVEYVRDSNIPVIGINTGRLGFLANFTVDEMGKAIDQLANKSYKLDSRSVLEVTSDAPSMPGVQYALNEFTLQKKEPSAVIKVQAFVNGEFLSAYWSDGVIVSTPTGSTGYSMSAGGSIILPQSGALAITPIAPHNLNLRPIIIPDNTEVKFLVEEHRGECYATVDSNSWKLSNAHSFTITKADFEIQMVCQKGHTFIDTLRSKLMWGLDSRNK